VRGDALGITNDPKLRRLWRRTRHEVRLRYATRQPRERLRAYRGPSQLFRSAPAFIGEQTPGRGVIVGDLRLIDLGKPGRSSLAEDQKVAVGFRRPRAATASRPAPPLPFDDMQHRRFEAHVLKGIGRERIGQRVAAGYAARHGGIDKPERRRLDRQVGGEPRRRHFTRRYGVGRLGALGRRVRPMGGEGP
jgi:hypothetical protein